MTEERDRGSLRSPGSCVGQRGDDGCGYTGGESGDTCPECGGMVLSKASLEAASRAAAEWERRDAATAKAHGQRGGNL